MLDAERFSQEVAALPEEAQRLILEFVSFLKQRYAPPPPSEAAPNQSLYQQFQPSGLIGCASVDTDLSTTYKQVLADQLNDKYDHR
ncbi:hypothetical protein [Halomicronema sp. CCY15110]|uniref:hypothetical protein n=1 Tax=Halomicronema sp. CCY15110 TaxID=2767773 RepID=UPI00194FBDE0|nr:hypothetical protein [Halomicronema sp. CCY15110]